MTDTKRNSEEIWYNEGTKDLIQRVKEYKETSNFRKIRECPVCKKKFTYHFKNKVYCSLSCLRKEFYKRKKMRELSKKP